jgi:site-specific DNA-methyltransferase (adenine-specific)
MNTVPSAPLLNKLILGDCIDIMKTAPDACIDFVLTDPPYGVNFRDRGGRTLKGDNRTSWILPAFREIWRLLKDDCFCVSFYGWNNAEKFVWAWKQAGFTPVGHLAFVKRYPSKTGFLAAYHEQAMLLAKGHPAKPVHPLPDVLPWEYSGNRWHPTQKPLEALLPLIASFSRPGELVLDPFAGSASTLIAARQLGRRSVGIEKDRAYYEAARRRLVSAS